MARIDHGTAASRSASAKTRLAPLPPSSRLTGVRLAAAARAIARPVADSPVNTMRSIAGDSVSHCPAASGPKPCTTLSTPSGKPARSASRAMIVADAGESSAGLSTTVLPQASAGTIFHVSSISGKFQGAMAAATPSCSAASGASRWRASWSRASAPARWPPCCTWTVTARPWSVPWWSAR
jgi:hypothetical protein